MQAEVLVAGDLMTPQPARVRVSSTVGHALKLLHELDVRHLPVVDADGELVGIVSDRDLRGPLPDEVVPEAPDIGPRTPITRVMSSAPVSVSPETGLREVVEMMIEQKVGALPVVDSDGRLVGIVSYIDLLRHLARQL